MDLFFLGVIFFIASAAIGRFSPIYIVVGSLFLFGLKRPGPPLSAPRARKISTKKSRAARFSPMEGLAAIRQHSRTPPFFDRPKKH